MILKSIYMSGLRKLMLIVLKLITLAWILVNRKLNLKLLVKLIKKVNAKELEKRLLLTHSTRVNSRMISGMDSVVLSIAASTI
jgi:hypothetical protein